MILLCTVYQNIVLYTLNIYNFYYKIKLKLVLWKFASDQYTVVPSKHSEKKERKRGRREEEREGEEESGKGGQERKGELQR